MCTVSYIPYSKNKSFVLTSNRDERKHRETLAPAIYRKSNIKVGYPKDVLAGGSWIAINNKGRLCCLLNGGFESHTKETYHTRSRGDVLLELIGEHEEALCYFGKTELNNVEPFTMITIDTSDDRVQNLSEFVWDGKRKSFRELDKNTPYIWSSATLYNKANREKRKQWFSKFLNSNDIIEPKDIFQFHSGKHSKDESVNLLMQRDGGLKTVSITQVSMVEKQLRMDYTDLLKNKKQQIVL